MYGFVDRMASSRVYSRPGASLGEVWRELRGMGNVAIIRMSDGVEVARRGLNGPWDLGVQTCGKCGGRTGVCYPWGWCR